VNADDVDEVIAIAQRLVREGLLQAQQGTFAAPQSLPGTVTAWARDYGSALVLVDGSDAPISVINALNAVVPPGTRVLVSFEPPHGVFLTNVFGIPFSVSHSETAFDEGGNANYTSSGSYVDIDLGGGFPLQVKLTKYSQDTAFLVTQTWNGINPQTPGGGNGVYYMGLGVDGPTPGTVAMGHANVHDDLADCQTIVGQLDFLEGFPIGDYTFTGKHARTGANGWVARGSLSLNVAEHPPW